MSLPAFPQSASGGGRNPVGTITSLIPNATRDGTPAKAKQDITPLDTLRTDRGGRARISLRDGSVLSMGADTEMKVVAHDPGAQRTEVELEHGRLRSRVVSVKQGGNFTIRMPMVVAHVIGTDFFLSSQPNGSMQLIVYSGRVWLQGTGAFAGQSVTVDAGQMVELGQSGFTAVQATPMSVQQDSIASTSTEGGPASSSAAASANSTLLRNILIGVGAAATGVAIAVTRGTANRNTTTSASKPPATTTTTSTSGNEKHR